MAFQWLDDFHKETQKAGDYAAKVLAAYRLGMKAGGSIVGVGILLGQDPCEAAAALDPETIYHPDDAPLLPLETCPRGGQCQCVYRPVMAYQVPAAEAEKLKAKAQARLNARRDSRRGRQPE